MFRKLKRIKQGFRWYFSTQQQQYEEPNFRFQNTQNQNNESSDQSFQFNNGNPFKQGGQNSSDLYNNEVTLPPWSDREEENNSLGEENSELNESKSYDVAIIGGGSGGLAFALEAQKLGLKVIVFDFVDPTQHGVRWGLGGTCVNVGCIPKKLFHAASMMGEQLKRQSEFGFGEAQEQFSLDLPKTDKSELNFRWRRFVSNVQNYISDLNLSFESQLINRNIPYINSFATIGDRNTIYYSKQKRDILDALERNDFSKLKMNSVKAQYILISSGGRPQFLPNCQNSQESISSDDLFSLKKAPGKTLVVGGGYVALECAGFLSNLGMDTSVMTRGKFLRDFDQDIVHMILQDMKQFSGVRFIEASLPYKIERRNASGQLKVCFNKVGQETSHDDHCEMFDTVLQAIGRKPNTSLLNLKQVGVETHKQTQKILGGHEGDSEKTSVSNIFAIGDVLQGVPELTPPAQMAGRLLAHRIHGLRMNDEMKYYEQHKMDYKNIPTTVFTPQEYSCVGMSEEQAIQEFGSDDIEIYHSRFTPLEEQLSFSYDDSGEVLKRKGYCKIICIKSKNNKVLGLHYYGPNAGEVMQGYAVAFTMNLHKHQLDNTLGIHPTCAEEFLNLSTTKRSGDNFDKETC